LVQQQLQSQSQSQQITTAEKEDGPDDDDSDDSSARRGVEFRQYIKEKLMGHRIWHDGSYWEQALWQCALEQVSKHLMFPNPLLLTGK
jgi:hypothetical protein